MDEVAMRLIYEHVSDSFMDDLDDCKTAAEAWAKFERACTIYTMYDQIQLLGELLDHRKPDSLSMENYIAIMNQLNKRVKAGKLIDLPDAVQAALYLRGLPKEYEILVRTIEPQEEELTTTYIKSKLILEDRRKTCKENMGSKHTALKTFSISSNTRQRTGGDATKAEKGTNIYFCYACGGKGHIAKYCKKLQNEKGKSKKPNEANQQKLSQAGSASIVIREYKALSMQKTNSTSREGIWLLDGGASDTMTSRSDLFCDFTPTFEEVTVEDGTPLKIEGKGKILLHISDECGGPDLDFLEVLYVPKLQDNLISQGTLDKKGMTIVTANGRADISDQGKVFLTAQSWYYRRHKFANTCLRRKRY